MFVGKELLLSCIVMIHVSFMASQPIKLEDFRKKVDDLEKFSFRCSLQRAENDYVKDVLSGEPLNNVEPIEGITFGNSTEEIQASICAITDYLGNHLPKIIPAVIKPSDFILNKYKSLLKNFNDTFQKSSGGENEAGCNRTVPTTGDYDKKVIGFRIITSTRKWLEMITGTPVSCIGT